MRSRHFVPQLTRDDAELLTTTQVVGHTLKQHPNGWRDLGVIVRLDRDSVAAGDDVPSHYEFHGDLSHRQGTDLGPVRSAMYPAYSAVHGRG